MWGVSVVICSHNGSGKLPATLAHLAAQQIPPGLPWEVLVIDNGSTDDTAAVAHEGWSSDAPSPLRVIVEPQLGLTLARLRGLREARYEFVSFIDDDNGPAPDWISTVADIMGRHPEVGACGGAVEAVCETVPPQWFNVVQHYYAVGQQAKRAGDVTWSRGYLWGAGLTVRKSAWSALASCGFRFQLSDRAGREMSSGGDAELCLALRLAGWRLWYEPAMTMKHFIPASRLAWPYLERVARGFGVAAVVLNAYATVRQDRSSSVILRLRSNWLCQVFVTIVRLLRAYGRCVLGLPAWEGNVAVLEMMYRREVLTQFLHVRAGYDALCRHIQAMSYSAAAPGVALRQEA